MSDLMRVGADFGGIGTFKPFTANKSGAQRIVEAHARYFEQVEAGRKFGGSIVGQVTTVGLATTYTGLCLSNPVNSPVLLVPDKVGLAFLVAFAAAAAVGLMTGFSQTDVTHTTPAVVRRKMVSGTPNMGNYGKLDSAATISTPVVDQILMAGLTAAITTNPAIAGLFDLDGSIVIPPGGFMAVYTSTASAAASMSASFSWEEVPIV